MNIDWSEAPDGATHWDGADLGFMKPNHRAGNWEYFGMYGHWVLYGPISDQIRHDMIARPIQWNGEGLPPAGTVCEMLRDIYFKTEWQKVTFLCSGKRKVFFRDQDGDEWSRPLSELTFRPIRTPEQIAADEREHSIRNACTAISEALNGLHESEEPTAVAIIEAMIDAGFQQVAP